jgi:hypothetical protein
MTPRQHRSVARSIAKYVRQLLEIIEEKGGAVDWANERKRSIAKSTESENAASLDSEAAESLEEATPPPAEYQVPAQFGLF